MERKAKKFKKVSLTTHDGYIGIEWETEDKHGAYEFEKKTSGWKAYSDVEDETLDLLIDLIKECMLHVDYE